MITKEELELLCIESKLELLKEIINYSEDFNVSFEEIMIHEIKKNLKEKERLKKLIEKENLNGKQP